MGSFDYFFELFIAQYCSFLQPQPTLHKPGIMAHRVRVLFRYVISCSPLDFFLP